ncbi:RNA-binding domain-containing protein, partial [Martensiomyces pterosporus]
SNGKIIISNLDFGVTEADLRELFSQVGPVRRASLNFGPSGKSKGSGEVQFKNPAHAALAVERYHGVTLDGRTMKIELAFNPMAQVAASAAPSNKGRRNTSNNDPNASSSRRGGRRGGRRNDDVKRPAATKESLDADLDSYMK